MKALTTEVTLDRFACTKSLPQTVQSLSQRFVFIANSFLMFSISSSLSKCKSTISIDATWCEIIDRIYASAAIRILMLDFQSFSRSERLRHHAFPVDIGVVKFEEVRPHAWPPRRSTFLINSTLIPAKRSRVEINSENLNKKEAENKFQS